MDISFPLMNHHLQLILLLLEVVSLQADEYSPYVAENGEQQPSIRHQSLQPVAAGRPRFKNSRPSPQP